MNEDRLKGKWNQIKGELKKKWGKLTDDDLIYSEGQVEKMIGRIQERTGERKEEIQKFFDRYLEEQGRSRPHEALDFTRRMRGSDSRAARRV